MAKNRIQRSLNRMARINNFDTDTTSQAAVTYCLCMCTYSHHYITITNGFICCELKIFNLILIFHSVFIQIKISAVAMIWVYFSAVMHRIIHRVLYQNHLK